MATKRKSRESSKSCKPRPVFLGKPQGVIQPRVREVAVNVAAHAAQVLPRQVIGRRAALGAELQRGDQQVEHVGLEALRDRGLQLFQAFRM